MKCEYLGCTAEVARGDYVDVDWAVTPNASTGNTYWLCETHRAALLGLIGTVLDLSTLKSNAKEQKKPPQP